MNVMNWSWNDKMKFIRRMWDNQQYAVAVTAGGNPADYPQLTNQDIETGLKEGGFHYLQGKCFKMDVQTCHWNARYYDEVVLAYSAPKTSMQLYNEFMMDGNTSDFSDNDTMCDSDF